MKKKTKVDMVNITCYVIIIGFIAVLLQTQLLINDIRTQIKNDVIINANDQISTNN